eukprot:1160705-Pelagomonas_calceolata.AAC.14
MEVASSVTPELGDCGMQSQPTFSSLFPKPRLFLLCVNPQLTPSVPSSADDHIWPTRPALSITLFVYLSVLRSVQPALLFIQALHWQTTTFDLPGLHF